MDQLSQTFTQRLQSVRPSILQKSQAVSQTQVFRRLPTASKTNAGMPQTQSTFGKQPYDTVLQQSQ